MTTAAREEQAIPREASSSPNQHSSTCMTPSAYAQAVLSDAQVPSGQSRFSGSHFAGLARYLHHAFEARGPSVPRAQTNNVSADLDNAPRCFVSICDLDPSAPERIKHISSILDFEHKAESLRSSHSGHIVFLKGYPSPAWLLSIGAKYKVDPEFFQRHLGFRAGPRKLYSLPSLPSTARNIFKLRHTTVGASISTARTEDKQSTLNMLRAKNRTDLEAFKEKLKSTDQLALGDAIVRDTSIHDLKHFSIEQDVSVHVTAYHESWAVLIWQDTTPNLTEGHTSWLSSPLGTQPWLIAMLPTLQPKPGPPLRPLSPELIHSTHSKEAKTGQGLGLLHLDYGLSLDRVLASKDPFYALNDLFTLTALSENQFLNMLDDIISTDLDPDKLAEHRDPPLSNLLYNSQVLDRHIAAIKDNLEFIRSSNSAAWPRGTIDRRLLPNLSAARESLVRDHDHLLSRCLSLSEKCHKGMQVVMNNTMILESEKAIAQTERAHKLTLLAFIFIPLSFTSSFFGMNFSQFGQGTLSIWLWFATSLPVFLISILFASDNAMNILKTCFL